MDLRPPAKPLRRAHAAIVVGATPGAARYADGAPQGDSLTDERVSRTIRARRQANELPWTSKPEAS